MCRHCASIISPELCVFRINEEKCERLDNASNKKKNLGILMHAQNVIIKSLDVLYVNVHHIYLLFT